jgi:hypothetical protein
MAEKKTPDEPQYPAPPMSDEVEDDDDKKPPKMGKD